MAITRDDIINKVFSRSALGYDDSEVDSFLDDLMVDLENCQQRLAEMQLENETLKSSMNRINEEAARVMTSRQEINQLREENKILKNELRDLKTRINEAEEDGRLRMNADRKASEILSSAMKQAEEIVQAAERQRTEMIQRTERESAEVMRNAENTANQIAQDVQRREHQIMDRAQQRARAILQAAQNRITEQAGTLSGQTNMSFTSKESAVRLSPSAGKATLPVNRPSSAKPVVGEDVLRAVNQYAEQNQLNIDLELPEPAEKSDNDADANWPGWLDRQ
jgi:DivIVA domain